LFIYSISKKDKSEIISGNINNNKEQNKENLNLNPDKVNIKLNITKKINTQIISSIINEYDPKILKNRIFVIKLKIGNEI